jgi:hypothetical protein
VAATMLVAACARGKDAGSGPYAREVAEAIPRIEQATGLKFKTPPKVEVRTREQVRDFLLKQFDEATPTAQLAGEEKAYKLLGLIPDTMNLRAFFVRVLTEQVVGYYDPKAKTLYVVQGADEQVVGITITHELVHALQDQYVNIDSIQKSGSNNDRLAAAQALIEGEAQFEQISIMLGGPIRSRRAAGRVGPRARGDSQSPGRDAGVRHRADGDPGVAALPVSERRRVRAPREGESAAATILFRDIPRSTEQILHPPSFLSTPPDEPTTVTLPAPAWRDEGLRERHGRVRHAARRVRLPPRRTDRSACGSRVGRRPVHGRRARQRQWHRVGDRLGFARGRRRVHRRHGARHDAPHRRPQRSVGAGVSYTSKGRTISIQPVSIGDRAVVLLLQPAGRHGIGDRSRGDHVGEVTASSADPRRAPTRRAPARRATSPPGPTYQAPW